MNSPDTAAALYAPICEQVRRCAEQRRPLAIRGGGTLCAGRPADDGEVCDMRAYAALIEHAHADMTITVQAGMTVAELQSVLAQRGQSLGIDVPAADRTTVGGMIAADLCGSRRFSRGTVRDLLLGIGIVAGEGQYIRAGGRVVKNVAGYDLSKLYTGSWGWLGVIVEATFRVSAIAESAGAVCGGFESAEAAEAACEALLKTGVQPASIDLLNAAAARTGGVTGEADVSIAAAPVALLVGFMGMNEDVSAQLSACCGLFPFPPKVLDGEAYRTTGSMISDLTVSAGFFCRLSVLSSKSAELVDELSKNCPEAVVAAHAGNGIVNALYPRHASEQIRWGVDRASRSGGSWLIHNERAAAAAKIAMLGPGRPDWGLMRRTKEALDPAGVFGRDGPFDRTMRGAV